MEYQVINCKEYELQDKLTNWAKDNYQFISLAAYPSGFNVYVIAVIGKEKRVA